MFGHQAADNITTGSYNTCIGSDSGEAITTGSRNTLLGYYSMGRGNDTDDNTVIGYEAGDFIQGSGGTDGCKNTCLGAYAGDNITTGANNTAIGYGADVNSATGSNEITLGNGNISALRCQVQSISSLSDRRDKTDIVDLPVGIDFVNKLKPVKFKWDIRNADADNPHQGTTRAGFIAQDFKELQEDENATFLDLTLEGNPEKLEAKQSNLIPVLVKAIQELSAEVEALKAA